MFTASNPWLVFTASNPWLVFTASNPWLAFTASNPWLAFTASNPLRLAYMLRMLMFLLPKPACVHGGGSVSCTQADITCACFRTSDTQQHRSLSHRAGVRVAIGKRSRMGVTVVGTRSGVGTGVGVGIGVPVETMWRRDVNEERSKHKTPA